MKKLSTRTEAQNYFGEFLEEMKDIKIFSIFSIGSPIFNSHHGYRSYWLDENLYMMFENKKCLVIRYLAVDALSVDFRELNAEEVIEYEKRLKEEVFIKDYFNDVSDIYNSNTWTKERREEVNLEYGRIKEIQLSQVLGEYSKWEHNKIIDVIATEETFNDITILMDNGKSIVIYAGDEYDDGACRIYSEDALENVSWY